MNPLAPIDLALGGAAFIWAIVLIGSRAFGRPAGLTRALYIVGAGILLFGVMRLLNLI